MAQLVERYVRDVETGGSNPPTPTKFMGEKGFDYPNSIKYLAQGKQKRFDDITGQPIREKWYRKLIRETDTTFIHARQVLENFNQGYFGANPDAKTQQNKGWSLIRTYDNPDTGFSLRDPIAPDSIVVMRLHEIDDNGKPLESFSTTIVFYISNRKGKHGEPLIFYLTNSDNGSNKQRVICENIDMEVHGMSFDYVLNLFNCALPSGNDVFQQEITVWKQGKPSKEKVRQQSKYSNPIRNLTPAPQPI